MPPDVDKMKAYIAANVDAADAGATTGAAH
jgi:hypothetical protein